MKYLWDVLKKYSFYVVATILALIFCFVFIYDNRTQSDLEYDYPTFAEGNNIWYYNAEITQEGISYSIDYPYWTVEQLGVRLYFPEENVSDGTVTIKILSEDGTTEYGAETKDYSEIVHNEINYFDFSCDVVPGTIQICLSCEGDTLLTFGANESDSEGNLIYDGLEVHFVVSSVAIGLLDLFTVIILLLIIAFVVLIIKKKLTYEQIFVIGYILLGAVFFLILSPLAECDAGNHMRRILAALQGHLIGITDENNQIGASVSWPLGWDTGDSAYISLYTILHQLNYHVGSYNEQFLTYTNVALYSPFSYTTALIGAFLGRLITTRLVFIILAARVFNYICTGLLMYIAIKLTPFGKRYICMILFLPMFMQQAVGIAPDSMIIALITLLTAIVLRLRFSEQKLTKGYIAALYIITFLLGQYKIVYVLFCLMVFAVPKEKFGSGKKYMIHALVMGGIVAISSLAWLKISSGILSNGYMIADSQFYKMTTRFGEYIVAIFRSIFNLGTDLVAQILGLRMGAFAVEINHLLLVVFLILFVYELTVIRQHSNRADKVTRGLLLGCVLGTVFLIYTAEYIQWNDGINTIGGVQGRYFLPFAFPMLLLIGGFEDGDSDKMCKAKTVYLHGLILLCFIPQILLKYLYFAD